MKRIVFVRHGRPAALGLYVPGQPVAGSRTRQMLHDYSRTSLDRTLPPPLLTCEAVAGITAIFSSGLRRSIETAQWLCTDAAPQIEPLFREIDLPSGYLPFLRMRPVVWMAVLRIFWLCGLHRNAESKAAAKERAKNAAELACAAIEDGESIMVSAHGYINLLMIRHLRAGGWRLRKPMRHDFWACNEVIR
jgi:broad specificity phosphatase PhoE